MHRYPVLPFDISKLCLFTIEFLFKFVGVAFLNFDVRLSLGHLVGRREFDGKLVFRGFAIFLRVRNTKIGANPPSVGCWLNVAFPAGVVL